MISVRNLQQLLSGSKIIILFSAFTLIISCSPSHKATMPSHTTKPKTTNKPSPETKTKIDTIIWNKNDPKIDPKPKSDNDVNNTKTNTNPSNPNKKYIKEDSAFRIVTLLPLKSNDVDTSINKIPPANVRFIHFYAGMKMAVEEMNHEYGKKVVLDFYDVQSYDNSIAILDKYNKTPPSLIIGPYKSETLKQAADWAKSHETTLLSPWVSSSSIADQNPYYVQLKAGLTAQYKKLNQHTRSTFPVSNIVLISKNEAESKSRYFNDSTIYNDKIEEKIIKEEDLAGTQTSVLLPLIKAEGPTIFILPMASAKDENYIYHFLRRVALEKGTKEVIVYGMHKWLELKPEITEYLNVQKVRLSISNYVDSDNNEVRQFKKRYFNKYREFPSEEALEGYDVMKYGVRSLRNYGIDFQSKVNGIISSGIQTSFQLIPIYKVKQNADSVPDYYENSYIKIIEVRNNKYRIID